MKPIGARPSLTAEAASVIRREILSGRLKAGEHLVETRLAANLGISRGPVREALKMLVAEGLLGEEPNRGVYVISLTEDDVSEIYDLRAGLETRAVRLLARAHRAQDAAALRAPLEQMMHAATAGDEKTAAAADLAFHTTVLELTGNKRLLETFNRAVPVLRALIPLDAATYLSLTDEAQEHWPLVQAIEAGDEEVAARHARQHVEDGGKRVIARLRAERTKAGR